MGIEDHIANMSGKVVPVVALCMVPYVIGYYAGSHDSYGLLPLPTAVNTGAAMLVATSMKLTGMLFKNDRFKREANVKGIELPRLDSLSDISVTSYMIEAGIFSTLATLTGYVVSLI